MDTHLNKTIGKIKKIMAKMNNLKSYISEKQRIEFANAYLVSTLKYSVQFLVGETNQVKNK